MARPGALMGLRLMGLRLMGLRIIYEKDALRVLFLFSI